MVRGKSGWIDFHIHQIVVAAADAAGVVGAEAVSAVAVADAEGDVVVAVDAAAADGDDEQGL